MWGCRVSQELSIYPSFADELMGSHPVVYIFFSRHQNNPTQQSQHPVNNNNIFLSSETRTSADNMFSGPNESWPPPKRGTLSQIVFPRKIFHAVPFCRNFKGDQSGRDSLSKEGQLNKSQSRRREKDTPLKTTPHSWAYVCVLQHTQLRSAGFCEEEIR